MTLVDRMYENPYHAGNNDMESSRSSHGHKKPYRAHHPQAHHHRRVRAQRESTPPPPEVDINIESESFPNEPEGNPNDPFEQHFLAASLAAPPTVKHDKHDKIRSSSFRNDKEKPVVTKRVSADLSSGGNYSSSPNLLFPKDGAHHEQGRLNEARSSDGPLRRVRSFKTTSKGVVNRGDSFRKKNSSRNVASGSTNGFDSPRLDASHSQPSQSDFECTASPEEPPSSYFRVQLVGAPGCGKTSITNQFMSSDYANAYDSMNADDIERTVTIQLDGEEFTLEFIDALPWDDTADSDIDVTADAYVVVYSVIDRVTFDAAVQSLYRLRHGLGSDRPIILVGNKIDLVRKRKVKKGDVNSISRTYDCLQFETSAALNHHVDELLVAILRQIRHKLNPEVHPSPEGQTELLMKKRDSKGAAGFLTKLYRRLSRKGRAKGK
ncbi:GTP-binding protein REM 1-like isoform X2 [Dreissena polymorpha]|uniref:Uncharacterized protein n=1 Tax=Dreissena polymorpha TaxID=45954 RepID=A0A9D4IHL1_DREPO|nr:GTP-binding protein REM 1-like isoform X2 [Dreissena polymorpha]KAH3772792.1 hypothetical protein DPMN_174138 [Dreissena polymorpha]